MLFGWLSGKKPKGVKKKPLLKFPRSLKVTREGKFFIGVLLLIGVAAINTGNNLLYLVVATLLSLIIVSGVMSESTLRGVAIKRTFPRQVYKGSPALARVHVENRKKILPSFSFKVIEAGDDTVKAEPAYFLKLGPAGRAEKSVRYTFMRRGLYRLEGLKISTRFPFGLFIKGKEEEAFDEVLVYPSIKDINVAESLTGLGSWGVDASSKRGEGTELYSLRDYAFGDDSRLIHWRSAARASRLLVKEFEKEQERKAVIIFENFSSDEAAAFEEAVDRAATLADRFINTGWSVGLRTLDSEIKPSKGPGQLSKILHTLALITPLAEKGHPAVKVSGL